MALNRWARKDIRLNNKFRSEKNLNILKDLANPSILGFQSKNRFVFTCTSGWIDHGHFFNNAKGTYLLEGNAYPIKLISNAVEGAQNSKVNRFLDRHDIKNMEPSSAWTPEDLISNELGRQFGRNAYTHDKPNFVKLRVSGELKYLTYNHFPIPKKWNEVLRVQGAVAWSDPKVEKILR